MSVIYRDFLLRAEGYFPLSVHQWGGAAGAGVHGSSQPVPRGGWQWPLLWMVGNSHCKLQQLLRQTLMLIIWKYYSSTQVGGHSYPHTQVKY